MTPELREKLAGRTVVASVSGGKDSAALSLWLTEQGIEHRRVFMDTGWEHELTYEYLRGPLTQKLGAIEEIRGPLGFADLVRKKGMFPSRTKRFCTQELKVFPFRDWLRVRQDAGEEFVNAVGIRREESNARRAALVARETPDKIDEIRGLESEVNETNKKGNASFYSLRPDNVKHVQAPIDQVVEWAQTGKGGKQKLLPLIEDPPDIGCMRWGLCDTGRGAA